MIYKRDVCSTKEYLYECDSLRKKVLLCYSYDRLRHYAWYCSTQEAWVTLFCLVPLKDSIWMSEWFRKEGYSGACTTDYTLFARPTTQYVHFFYVHS